MIPVKIGTLFSPNNLNATQKLMLVFEMVDNIVGKGKKMHQHLLFLCFERVSLLWMLKLTNAITI